MISNMISKWLGAHVPSNLKPGLKIITMQSRTFCDGFLHWSGMGIDIWYSCTSEY